MSKSKKNVVDPQSVIDIYGADAVRWFMLSDSPPERDIQWSEEGIAGCHKFIQKVWSMAEMIQSISDTKKISKDKKLELEKEAPITIYITKMEQPKPTIQVGCKAVLATEWTFILM